MSDTPSNNPGTPHCLRHANVTHETLRLTMEAVCLKTGHSSPAVTQAYIHVPVSREIDDPLNPQEEK
jgi:site-specific recombinase XerD